MRAKGGDEKTLAAREAMRAESASALERKMAAMQVCVCLAEENVGGGAAEENLWGGGADLVGSSRGMCGAEGQIW